MELPKETLVEMVNMWVKNYWTNQNYWMVNVERDFGFDDTARLTVRCGKVQPGPNHID